MQPKRFSGASVRAVLTEVREQFGRDALILEQRTVGNTVEMLATSADAVETPAQRISAQLRYDAQPAQETLYVRRLRDLGFSETLLARLPAQLPDWHTAMAALVRQLPLASHLPTSGLVTVTGPAGAGVTSSLIRYAVHLLRSGKDPRRLKFVHASTPRLGGDEALQLAGQSLGVDVQRAGLDQVVSELADAHPETLVLADLSLECRDQIATPQHNDPLVPSQELLVLPAHWHTVAIDRWLGQRQDTPADRHRLSCVVTNVERGPQWGEWLSRLAERQWPLALVSHGPKLPDDMCVPSGAWLSDRLFDQIDRSASASSVKEGV